MVIALFYPLRVQSSFYGTRAKDIIVKIGIKGKMETPSAKTTEAMMRLVQSMNLNNGDALASTLYDSELFKEVESNELQENICRQKIHNKPKTKKRIIISSPSEYKKFSALHRNGKLSHAHDLMIYNALLEYKRKFYEDLWSDSSNENALRVRQEAKEFTRRLANGEKHIKNDRRESSFHSEFMKYVERYNGEHTSSIAELSSKYSPFNKKKQSNKSSISRDQEASNAFKEFKQREKSEFDSRTHSGSHNLQAKMRNQQIAEKKCSRRDHEYPLESKSQESEIGLFCSDVCENDESNRSVARFVSNSYSHKPYISEYTQTGAIAHALKDKHTSSYERSNR